MQNFTLYFQEHKKLASISGIILLVALILGVTYTIVGNPFAPAVTAPTKVTPHTPPQVVDFSQTQAASGTVKYLLPKSKVDAVYASIYNNMANETLVLMQVYQNDMLPLLTQVQTAAKNKDYQKMENLGRSVKVVNDAQKVRLATLSGDLDSLAIANKNEVADPETMRLTDEVVTTGKDMVAKYTAMANLVDNMLSGKISGDTASNAKTISSGLEPSARAFFTAAQKLGTYFTVTLKSDVKAYIAASTTATSTKK